MNMGEGKGRHMWCVSSIGVNQKGVVKGISCLEAKLSYLFLRSVCKLQGQGVSPYLDKGRSC